MSHTAVVKFAPIFTLERFDDPAWRSPGRTMYYNGALKFLPAEDSVPLIVDHNDARQIGTVHELFKMDWTDGPWICARATVDTPPSWLKRGTGASFRFIAPDRREVDIRGKKAEVIAWTIVREVSVLSPTEQPAEPRAEVLSYHPTEVSSSPAAVPASSDRAAGGEVPRGLSDAQIEELQAAERRNRYAEVRAKQGIIVRHGVGQVLAVGGKPLRASSGQAIRRVDRDYILDQPDGSQLIYSAEGYKEALRDGTLRVR